jgi:hypothetical protein
VILQYEGAAAQQYWKNFSITQSRKRRAVKGKGRRISQQFLTMGMQFYGLHARALEADCQNHPYSTKLAHENAQRHRIACHVGDDRANTQI